MSTDTFARVKVFEKKAFELAEKGHVLRAAENYGRAAEAAGALGEDNLVSVHMQLLQGELLSTFVMMASTETPPAESSGLAASRAECIAVLSGVVDALERRCVAGTLLESSAAEKEWRVVFLQECRAQYTAAEAADAAPLFGYEQFLRGAGIVLSVLGCPRLFATECSDVQFQSFVQHVVHAAELMQQPRRHGNMPVGDEVAFTDMLHRSIFVTSPPEERLDARLVQQLAGAWHRLQRSGVLQTRHIEEAIQLLTARKQYPHLDAIKKSMSAPGLRSCALPGCGAKEAHSTHFKSCAACRTVVYCCREHQVAGWPGHKKACKAARKAAAAAEDEAGPSGA